MLMSGELDPGLGHATAAETPMVEWTEGAGENMGGTPLQGRVKGKGKGNGNGHGKGQLDAKKKSHLKGGAAKNKAGKETTLNWGSEEVGGSTSLGLGAGTRYFFLSSPSPFGDLKMPFLMRYCTPALLFFVLLGTFSERWLS